MHKPVLFYYAPLRHLEIAFFEERCQVVILASGVSNVRHHLYKLFEVDLAVPTAQPWERGGIFQTPSDGPRRSKVDPLNSF